MKNGFNLRRVGVMSVAVLGAMAMAGTADAKGGGGVKPAPQPCVEKGGFTAWGGLLLSPWNITTPTGETWSMTFDDGGVLSYNLNRGAGTQKGTYLQPFTTLDSKKKVIFTINVDGGNVLPLSDCTMIVTTDIGALYMRRT